MRAKVARVLGWLTFLVVACGAPPVAILLFDASTATTFSIGFGGLVLGATLGAVVDYYLGARAASSRPPSQPEKRPPSYAGIAIGLLILNGAGALACIVLFLPWFPASLMIFYAIVGGVGFGVAATSRFGNPVLVAGVLGAALGVATYFGGRYLVVSFAPSAVLESPVEAPQHPAARLFELRSGRPRPDAGFGTNMGSLEGYTTYSSVVPVLDDRWTPGTAVPMWVACTTTVQYGKYSSAQWVEYVRQGCGSDWPRGRDTMRMYFDDEDSYGTAFAHAAKQGLRSAPGAPLVTWLGDREAAATVDRMIFLTSAVTANVLWLIVGPLLIFLGRRPRRQSPHCQPVAS